MENSTSTNYNCNHCNTKIKELSNHYLYENDNESTIKYFCSIECVKNIKNIGGYIFIITNKKKCENFSNIFPNSIETLPSYGIPKQVYIPVESKYKLLLNNLPFNVQKYCTKDEECSRISRKCCLY